MKGLALVVAGCTASLLTSCASQPQIRTPLPPGVTNPRPPQADLPQPVAAFVGVWAGRWETVNFTLGAGSVGVDETMIIESVMPISNDSYQAYLIISYGQGPDPHPPGFFRTTGVIGQDGVLRIKPFPNGSATTARVSANRQLLHIEHRGISRAGGLPVIVRGTLWRTTLP